MKVVTRTGDYTIYRKRNQRYAVRNNDRAWVQGEDKVAILLAHNLMAASVPSAPDNPEAAPADTAPASDTAEVGDSDASAAEQGDS